MDWNAHFKAISNTIKPNADATDGKEQTAIPPITEPVKPKWYDVRHWGLGDWGSAASIIGVGLWLKDQFKR